ncbi:hypothetical protein DP939_28525 [Spongiactinospora rosea]|uniref:Uncharacterized protein n=1 Tax=Spongiactinospora rosea TaxID=2248750 RepID=A0A366LRT5_9ACTN|nr:hypothetical protein DP939_28525 [Spongiactinospora rosea]
MKAHRLRSVPKAATRTSSRPQPIKMTARPKRRRVRPSFLISTVHAPEATMMPTVIGSSPRETSRAEAYSR